MYQLIFWLGKYLVMGALPTLEMNRKSQRSKFLHAELILIVKASRSVLLDHSFPDETLPDHLFSRYHNGTCIYCFLS